MFPSLFIIIKRDCENFSHMARKKRSANVTFKPYVYEFPQFSKGKILRSVFVFEEQECNSPRFCLAATHPTNEKMPTFKASWCIFKFSLWPVRCKNSCGFATNGLFKRVSFLTFVLAFTFEAKMCPEYFNHAALLTQCCVAQIQLRLVLISLPGH